MGCRDYGWRNYMSVGIMGGGLWGAGIMVRENYLIFLCKIFEL